MKPGIAARLATPRIAALLLCACGKAGGDGAGVVQTGFPGQLSAGGGTSGAVMAQATGAKPQASMPAGTPGIPKGSEGNVGGTELGGTGGQSRQGAERGGAGTPAPSASTAPPVREGRGNIAPDAGSASSSVPRGNVADAPPPARQADKERSQ